MVYSSTTTRPRDSVKTVPVLADERLGQRCGMLKSRRIELDIPGKCLEVHMLPHHMSGARTTVLAVLGDKISRATNATRMTW